jgi:site-specific DNA recombinase
MLTNNGQWDMILVMKMDRIHRNSKNFMIMMENLEKSGKKFTSMSESLDTSTAVGRFVVDIIQRIAQLESEQIGERTYMGMRQKVESGSGLAGFNAPFGYRFDNRKLEVAQEEAETVRSVFSAYSEGRTLRWIAWNLNRGSIRTKRGRDWTIWSISRMLHNPIYSGFIRWDGLIMPSDHKPIVSGEVFNRVQAKMESRVKNPLHRKCTSLPLQSRLVFDNPIELEDAT